MFWAEEVAAQAKDRYAEKIKKGEKLIIRDEKTLSGRVHVGSLRGVVIHGIIAEVLAEQGIACEYFFELNDFDPMDGLPVYLDKEKFAPYMGKPLLEVPSPDGKAKNFAEYFGNEFTQVISELGFTPTYYRSSEVYKSGRYNPFIKLAIEHAADIRRIYQEVSGSKKTDEWLPLNVICPQCGKVGTTRASDFDGTTVAYTCGDYVEWAKGCGSTGRVSPYDGNAKLPWKVEWAAKFSVMNVDIEGGGKDHSTKGGSRDIADTISREVFGRIPPINVPYEFFLVGGKKMSSSKGSGSSSREVADLLPPHIARFLIAYKEPLRVIDFQPDGDTIPLLYDFYDKYAENYFSGNTDDFAKIFALAHSKSERANLAELKNVFRPRFSLIAFLVQMPHMDIVKEVEKMAGRPLTEADKKEVELRARYARLWLEKHAPENYLYKIQADVPALAAEFTELQKTALKNLLAYVKSVSALDGQELHTKLHGLKEEVKIEPKALFEAIYVSVLGKNSGPKAGWFLSVLDKKFLEARLEEVSR